MLLKMVVISLSQGGCDRTHSRPNKDRLEPAGHIVITSGSFHTVLWNVSAHGSLLTVQRYHTYSTVDTHEVMYISKNQMWKWIKPTTACALCELFWYSHYMKIKQWLTDTFLNVLYIHLIYFWQQSNSETEHVTELNKGVGLFTKHYINSSFNTLHLRWAPV